MNRTIDLKVCPKCDFASEAAGNFCSSCGQAFDGSGTNYRAQAGNGYYRDEYGWQPGPPPGDPRSGPQAEAFWSGHKIIEDDSLSDTGDIFTTLGGLIVTGFAIYGVCKFFEKISDNDKLLNEG